MKTSCLALAVLFSTLGTYGEVATSTPYAVVQRDANSRVWERTTYAKFPSGKVVPTKHHYTELATGLCYSQNGQYVDSVEQINLVGNGAEAVQGPCKVRWASDASTARGAVRLTTPGGQQFTSRVFGLALRDTSTGSSVLIAQITNSTGVLVGQNQILYPSAFSGLQADIQDIYRKSGFEQNVVLREQPPSPADYGLNPATTRLEVLTEFFNPPVPKKTTVKTGGESDDVKLDFGDLHIGQGTAFLTPGQDNPSSKKVKVAKHWEKLDNGRVFLIEEVPLQGMTNLLQTLPPHASTGKTRGKVRRTASLKSLLQAGNAIQKSSGTIKVAQAMFPPAGVVIDYTTVTDGVTSYDFLSDATYLVSGYFWINDPAGMGSVSFEAGTVVKFASDGNIEDASTTDGNFNGYSYQPVIFTSSDDDSVGERIDGSSGSPSMGTAYYYVEDGIYLTNVTVANVRFSYAGIAYGDVYDSGFFFKDCQFVNCGRCTYFPMTSMYISYKNILATKCEYFFWIDSYSQPGSLVLDAENITFNSCNQFYADPSIPWNMTASGGITNSILTPCDGSATTYFHLDHTTTGSTNGVYQPSGAGSSYLTNGSTNWNAGTTNIDPVLLADLETKTTHAPISLTGLLTTNCVISPQAQLDTNGSTVDRGYHYDPLDCVIYNLQVTNATMTVLPGTLLAIGGWEYGIKTLNRANVQFLGAPAQPINIIHYNSVQEGYNTNLFSTNSVNDLLIFTNPATLNFRFVNWWPFIDETTFNVASSSPTNALSLFGCQFENESVNITGVNVLATNCLFQGVAFALDDGAYTNSPSFYNNLFTGGSSLMMDNDNGGTWTLSDNLFDRTGVSQDNSVTANYNGYVTNYNRLSPHGSNDVILSSSPAYQTGTLGVYYYPTNLTNLIYKGSRSASAAGLSDYTVTTNNVADGTNTVSIGYHYLAEPNDWWVGFFNQYDFGPTDNDGDDALSLYISSPVEADGTVTIPGLGFTSTFTVVPGAIASINIPLAAMTINYDVIETNGIHITASQPVSVYGLNIDVDFTTVFTGYPTTLLGTNYCVMARPSDNNLGLSQLAIVATTNNTTVTITPSATADLFNYGTTPFIITLQQGETYQINSSNITDDVTGTFVTSDKPIAVFAGASDADVPDGNFDPGHPLVQEQVSVDLWGTNTLALSFAGRTNGDSYRVLAASNDTVITITGNVVTVVDETVYPPVVTTSHEVVVVTKQAGQFYDIIVDGPVEFQGSKPIQVAHFANGCLFDNTHTFEGQPCEILLPPTGHYLLTNTVYTMSNNNPNGGFDENFLNLIVSQSATNQTLLDGSLLAGTSFVAITNGYFGARIPVAGGPHTVTSSQPVGVEVYGFGTVNAYGYFSGRIK